MVMVGTDIVYGMRPKDFFVPFKWKHGCHAWITNSCASSRAKYFFIPFKWKHGCHTWIRTNKLLCNTPQVKYFIPFKWKHRCHASTTNEQTKEFLCDAPHVEPSTSLFHSNKNMGACQKKFIQHFLLQKSETRMTASILKWDVFIRRKMSWENLFL